MITNQTKWFSVGDILINKSERLEAVLKKWAIRKTNEVEGISNRRTKWEIA